MSNTFRRIFFLASASLAFHSDAATTVVTNQPPVYADREVYQVALVAGCCRQTRLVNVELAFTATPSNNEMDMGSYFHMNGMPSICRLLLTTLGNG